MTSTVKSFTITGDSSIFGKKGRGSSRKARKEGEEPSNDFPVVRKHGGSSMEGPPVKVMNVATAGVLPLGVKSVVTGYQSPSMPAPGASLKELHMSGQMGGGLVSSDRQIHVELKNKSGGVRTKVHLNPKKSKSESGSNGKTRKARKVTLGMNSFQTRMTRAKKIREKVKEMPFDDLRKELIKRGLIKESSKAPESILRQIAADAQIVSGKGL